MLSPDDLAAAAADWLATAVDSRESGRFHVAFEAARHAAELAGKALLLRATGRYPREHTIAGELSRAGLLPESVPGRELHKLLADSTRGTYGFDRPLAPHELSNAMTLAQAMVDAAR